VNLDLPIVDADLMGRAFPELHMMTTSIYGLTTTPATVADERGNTVTVSKIAPGADWLERLLRPVSTVMGCSAGFCSRPLTGRQVKDYAVVGSLSLAWRIGKEVIQVGAKERAAEAVVNVCSGRVLYEGKITDVVRNTQEGFARGHVVVQSSSSSSSAHDATRLWVDFQNE